MQIPTLALGWIGFGTGYADPRYGRDAHGRVSIERLMQSGNDGTVFTLLAGYRPGRAADVLTEVLALTGIGSLVFRTTAKARIV